MLIVHNGTISMMCFYLSSSFFKLKNIIDKYESTMKVRYLKCTLNTDKTGNIRELSDHRNLSIMKTVTEFVIYQCLIFNFMSTTAII